MVIPTCSVSFSIIVCRYFPKWRINVFLKLKRLQQPPSPSDFDGLPYPRVRWYPKMTAKDVKEITYMPLVTFFSILERPGKTRKGVATTPPPLVRRGLNFQCLHLIVTVTRSVLTAKPQKLIFRSVFYVTIADVNIGSLKSLHTLFDKYLGHMLVKFEQNRIVLTTQNLSFKKK